MFQRNYYPYGGDAHFRFFGALTSGVLRRPKAAAKPFPLPQAQRWGEIKGGEGKSGLPLSYQVLMVLQRVRTLKIIPQHRKLVNSTKC